MGDVSERPECCEGGFTAVRWSEFHDEWLWTTFAIETEGGRCVEVETYITRCPYCGAALPVENEAKEGKVGE